MLRVGFALQGDAAQWLGGLNYLRNLMNAIWDLPDRRIEPVILTGGSLHPRILHGFPPVRVLQHQVFLRNSSASLLHKCSRFLVAHRFLLHHRICLLSHSGPLGPGSPVPSLGWIPDFQHLHLPELFTGSDVKMRESAFMKMCRGCTQMLVSSRDAQKDLERFATGTRSHILRFACRPPTAKREDTSDKVVRRYSLKHPFFLLPNQFWAHKNHLLVLRALHGLQQRGRRVLVAATGSTGDSRNAEHFGRIKAMTEELGVGDQFRILGVIPYPDLVELMRACLAFLQPSLFEGWSTSVEEAKSLGKRIIVSNIPVHLEQDPPGALFFDPHSAEDLQNRMLQLLDAPNGAQQAKDLARAARRQQDDRFREFGQCYQAIALDTIRRQGLWFRLVRRVGGQS